MPTVLICGGGVGGLAAAHRLRWGAQQGHGSLSKRAGDDKEEEQHGVLVCRRLPPRRLLSHSLTVSIPW